MTSEDGKPSNFCRNVRHLAAVNRINQVALAQKLGWDRTVLSKLMTGKRPPNVVQKEALAHHFVVGVAELDLDHEAFCARLGGDGKSSTLPLLTFRNVRENTRRWQPTFNKYRGQYVVYYRHVEEGIVIASLLVLDRLTGDGLHATLTNPHKDSSGSISAYEYEGYAYPVREYIYFLLEQKNADYEVLSIILREARTPTVTVLRGMITGIGVDKEVSYIAARPLVAQKRQRAIDNWRAVVGKELGYLREDSVQGVARKHLSSERARF
jgi:hypothetical protein